MNKILCFIILLLYLLSLINVIENFKIFKKKKKNRKNLSTGLNSRNTNKLEIMCLNSLKKNFKCICKKKRIHFPEIVKSYEEKNKRVIEMTHLGESILSLKKKILKN